MQSIMGTKIGIITQERPAILAILDLGRGVSDVRVERLLCVEKLFGAHCAGALCAGVRSHFKVPPYSGFRFPGSSEINIEASLLKKLLLRLHFTTTHVWKLETTTVKLGTRNSNNQSTQKTHELI